MNVNPYLAPQPPEQLPPAGVPQGAPGQPLYWEIGDVVGQGWAVFKTSWGPLVGAIFVSQLIGAMFRGIFNLPVSLGQLTPQDDAYWPLIGGATFLGLVVQQFFQVGLIKMWLAVARGRQPSFGDLFSGMSRFLPMVGVFFLTTLAVLSGVMLLIVPGVLLSLAFMLAPWFVVDQNMGTIDALRASWRATTGQKGKLFGLSFAVLGILLIGYCACCIGILAAVPLSQLATTIAYLRITGQGSYDPAAPVEYNAPPPGFGPPPGGGGGYGPPPGGGFGPPPGGGFGAPPGGGGYGPPGA